MKQLIGIFLLLIAITSPANAAKFKLSAGENTYYISTSSDAGDCRLRDLPGGGQEAVCSDGANLAAASTLEGCLDSQDAGYCARNRPQRGKESGSDLTCPDGKAYFIHTGVWDDNNCGLQDGDKVCRATGGQATAGASCRTGCLETRMSGICCVLDSDGSGCPLIVEGSAEGKVTDN